MPCNLECDMSISQKFITFIYNVGNRDNMFLQIVGTHMEDWTALKLRRSQMTFHLQQNPQILETC